MSNNSKDNAPWYRQFWCWFVFAPLILIVIVCSVFVSLAVNNSDDVIIDNYYKQGRMINQTFDQDKRALELQLEAEGHFDLETGEVVVTFAAKHHAIGLPSEILLVLSHPAKIDFDQHIPLRQTEQGMYRGELAERPANIWYVLVYAAPTFDLRNEAEWIIAGQINFEERDRLTLNPRQ